MSNQLFKGIKSVLGTSFAEVSAADRKGYIWFVRTVVDTDATAEGVQDDGNLTNDEYDIYFGTKHYAHYQEGQFEALENKITEAMGDNAKVAEALLKVAALVNATEGYGAIAVMDSEYATLADAFAAVVERIESAEEAIQGLQVALAEYAVKNIAEGDKVLTLADGILSSTLGLDYVDGMVRLTGKNNEVIAKFDASDFIKDSVLEDVKVDTKEDGEKYIIFTWKTEGEETKTDEIKVSDFAKLYDAGTALELDEDGVTFNVKVAENGNFLSVNENNELIVDDMTVDKTVLKEAITIEGGPLATDAVKEAFKNEETGECVIPAGTDIQAVLKALLCVEIYPTPTKNTPSFSISVAAPTISATGGTNNGLVEVGQEIKFATVTAKAVSVSKTEPEVSGFEHGYSSTIDGTINTATTITASWSTEQKTNHVYELVAAATGFTGTIPTTVTAATASDCKLAACTLVAVEGTNKYTVTEDAPDYIGSHTGISQYYVVSNLGGRKEVEKSVAIAAETDITKSAANTASTFTVTGVYPVYTNGVSASTTDKIAAEMTDLAAPVGDDGTKLGLMKAGTAFAVSFANQSLAPYKLFLPGDWKITSALAIDAFLGTFSIDCKSSFVANGTVTRKIQGNDVTYAVYEWADSKGPNRVKFTVA